MDHKVLEQYYKSHLLLSRLHKGQVESLPALKYFQQSFWLALQILSELRQRN